MELGMLLRPEALIMFLLTGVLLLEYVNAYNWYERNEDVCYILRYREARIHRDYIDKYASEVRTLRDCERACEQAFFACKSFSYSDVESEHCLLSRDDTHSLPDRNRYFQFDRDFSFYERKTGSRDCENNDGGSYQPNREGTYGECYILKKTREMIDQRYIRQTRRTSDREECEDLCSRESYCRGFNYRYKSHGTYQYKDNCELSEEDTRGADRRDFYTDDEFDFYEKSSSSSDCNRGSSGDRYTTRAPDRYTTRAPNYNRDQECSRISKTNYRLDDHVVQNSLNVRDKQECEEECLDSRRFTCKAFAYRRDSNTGRTWSNSWYDRQDNCFLTDRITYDISTYDFIFDRDSTIYDLNQNGRGCNGYGREDNYYDHNGRGRQYTANNLECYRGSRCREDHTAGYWWCEYDDAGAWDYCCRPDEECGRSRNYDDLFAWCYVGAGTSTQWRTCSTTSFTNRQYLQDDDPPNVTTTQESYNEADSLEVIDLNSLL